MAAKRRLSKLHSFFWLLVLVAVAVLTGEHTEHIDARLYNYAGKALGTVPAERTLHLLHAGQTAPREPDTTVETRRIECPAVTSIELDDSTAARCFAALPLGPQDFAVLLHKLGESCGTRHLAISAPLTWQGDTAPIARQMVALGITRFDSKAIGLRGRTTADADFTPAVLRAGSIPPEQVEGDTTDLPAANRAFENDLLYLNEAQQLAWAPDRINDERLTQNPTAATDRSFPLLARWNGEILPTLPLRLAMQIKGLKPTDIKVRMGKDIRLGTITLPLDERGCTRLQQSVSNSLKPESFIDSSSTPARAPIVLLSIPPDGKAEGRRPAQLAATISQLCATEITEYHTQQGAPGLSLMYRTPATDWLSLSILAAIALFAVRVLPYFPGVLCKLTMLAALGGLLWLAHREMQLGYWVHLTSAIATWLTLALALCVLRPTEMKRKR